MQKLFIGEVVAIQEGQGDWLVTFTVGEYWKGVREPRVSIFSAPPPCCACGLPVRIGKQFLIYAYRREHGSLETDICSSAALKSPAATEELRKLGRGKILAVAGKEPNSVAASH